MDFDRVVSSAFGSDCMDYWTTDANIPSAASDVFNFIAQKAPALIFSVGISVELDSYHQSRSPSPIESLTNPFPVSFVR